MDEGAAVTPPRGAAPRLLGRQLLVTLLGTIAYGAAVIPAVELGGWLGPVWLAAAAGGFLRVPPRWVAPGQLEAERLAGRMRPAGQLDARIAMAAVLAALFAVTRRLVWFTVVAPAEGPILDPPRGLALTFAAWAVVAVVYAPIAEEVLFRGWLQTPLERPLGPGAAISIAALLFSVIHLDGWDGVDHFLAGLVCGYFVWRSGSVWAGILLHAANNLVWVGLALVVRSEAELERITAVWMPGWAAALASVGLLAALIALGRRIQPPEAR